MKEVRLPLAALIVAIGAFGPAALLPAQPLLGQDAAATSAPPPSTGGFFPLSEVRKGMMATAWTVFEGDKPEPMQVEILGVLRGARGPGQDMILARLHGAKPEYTGVVAGMSGSPVYIGTRLLGSLSYRIGEFSKEPIAGITPIAQMIEVRDLPYEGLGTRDQGQGDPEAERAAVAPASSTAGSGTGNMNFQAMETPLVMSGFRPEAIALWQKQMAGTGLATIAAGGVGGSSSAGLDEEPSAKAAATVLPGSAVSAQLVRGDLEISATCTVTYIDPKQLLACGHPILQAGTVSLPMTTTDVLATLASPLNAFKIVNTGELIGAFTEDRDSAIRGVLGMKPHMIPVHIALHSPSGTRKLNIEILDLPSLTAQAMLVALYESMLESNLSTAETSYHLTGSIDLAPDGKNAGATSGSGTISPLDEWASASDGGSAGLELALLAGQRFQRIYGNNTRQGSIRAITLDVKAIPRRISVELEAARLVSSDTVHAGDTVMVEATLRPWRQPARNVRIPVKLPARLGEGNLRVLVSDAGTLDRTLDPPRFGGKPASLDAVLAQSQDKHAADRIYVSLLVPETQAGVSGQTLASLPLSVANAMEPARASQDVNLNGESAAVAADAAAGGVLNGFQILNLHIEPGGGLD